MGRFIGRRPDPTPRISRSVRRFLDPGEKVTAGIYVQAPGTNAAGVAGGASGGIGAAVGGNGVMSVGFSDDDAKHEAWMSQAEQFGIDRSRSRRAIWSVLVLTSSRLLLVRRTLIARRAHRVLAAWPVREIDGIRVPRNGSTLRVLRNDAELRFELPTSHRFLPDVYRDLPDMLARARTEAEGDSRGR